jgi:hypothetical protein
MGMKLGPSHKGRTEPYVVFVNWVLRKILGTKRGKIAGDWRKLHNEELHDLQSSTNVISSIKSRRMKWTGHVVHMVGKGNAYKLWWRNRKARGHLKDLVTDGRTILK